MNVGTRVVRLYARRDVAAERWRLALTPYLTSEAVQAHRATDPRTIPPTQISGGAWLTPASTSHVAHVRVPTSAGVYLLTLVRSAQVPAWFVDRIQPSGVSTSSGAEEV